MTLSTENILLIGSILLFVSVVAGKTSYRFGVPTLLLFLVIGMLAGSEGLGKIQFDDARLAQFIGIVALNFILFAGGMDTDWRSIKPVLKQGITLSTLGVLFTAVSVGLFVHWLTDFSLYEGLLLGAIVSSTDAAAVFSILRSKNLALKHNLRPTLELESGSNDPMAYFLTIAFTGLVAQPETNLWSIAPLFIQQISLGAVMGIGFGYLHTYIVNKLRPDFEGLYPVLVIALMFFSFSATDVVGGNGFLAVYLSAVILGNQEVLHKRAILKAFDGYAWLMEIILFLTLGLLVYPSGILPVAGAGFLIALFLIFIARPLSVFLSLSLFRMKNRSRWFISWVGLRGAVPIVFATYPLLAGIDKANTIFNMVFLISVSSVLLQGTTLAKVAGWLHVALPEKVKRKNNIDMLLSDSLKSELREVVIPQNSPAHGQPIVNLHIPKNTLIAIIERKGKYVTPNGSTILQSGDKLLLVSEKLDSMAEVFQTLGLNFRE
ncbi:MAG: potassium/proton antiporter [Bacteroidia bacterium]